MEALFVCNNKLKEDNKKIIIFGTNEESVLMFSVLMQNRIYVNMFCEPSAKNTNIDYTIMNKRVIPVCELEKHKDDSIIIIGDLEYVSECEKLERDGYRVYLDQNFYSYKGNCVLIQEKEEECTN